MFDLDLHLKKFAARPFFKDRSYEDLRSHVLSVSAQLRPYNDQFVALKMRSSYLSFVTSLALMNLKKVPVLLSHYEKENMINRLKEQVDFHLILNDEDVDLQFPSSETTLFPFEEGSLSCIVFSSGSSSLPKGVALSFQNIYCSALGFIEYFSQNENDVSVINLPHYHVGGMMILWRAFFSGSALKEEMNGRVDFLSLVPLQLSRMIENESDLLKLQNIRALLIGGAPLSATLKNKAEKKGLKIFETYGMTETTSQVLINGEVLPYREVMLDDANTFLINGKTLFMGYFLQKKFVPHIGWFKSADLGEKTPEGKFRFIRRNDLLFISGGENINPLFVEEQLKDQSKIKEAYLVPLEDPHWGQRGVLLYEGEVEADELRSFLKERLHPHWVPTYFYKTQLKFEGQIKPKRSELKIRARELYLRSIFHHHVKEINSDSPWLILLHGFLGNETDLMDITSDLNNQCNLLFIGLPGHGKTKCGSFYDCADFFNKLNDFIRGFSTSPLMYGYSMGGRVALHLALNYITPKKLFLESAGLGAVSLKEKSERLKSDLELFKNVGPKDVSSFLKKWYQAPMFSPYYHSERFRADCMKKGEHDMQEWQRSLNLLSPGHFPLLDDNLKKITAASIDLIYFYGEQDVKYKEMAQILNDLEHPHIKTFEIMGAGHNPHKTHLSKIKEILNILLK